MQNKTLPIIDILPTSTISKKSPIDELIFINSLIPQRNRQLQSGIITTSIIVEQSDTNSYSILYGLPILEDVIEQNQKSIFCIVIPDKSSLLSKLEIIIQHRQTIEEKSPVIDALLLSIVQNKYPREDVLALLPLMGHKKNDYTLNSIFSYLQFDNNIRTAIHNEIFSTKHCKLLKKLSSNDRNLIIEIIQKYKLGGSKQKRLLELAVELTTRKNSPFAEIFNDWQLKKTNDPQNTPQQSAEFLHFLQNESSPHLLKAKQEFATFVDKLNLPKEINILHCQSFEQDNVQVCINLKDRNRIVANLEELNKIASNEN